MLKKGIGEDLRNKEDMMRRCLPAKEEILGRLRSPRLVGNLGLRGRLWAGGFQAVMAQ